ncbi:5-(carboxyamino)imidazole ribonucleotide synthase [Allonocardiopsis opalescens]|uniref:N5-carboxyaminoimidazole ribonucleotide synthase n=2 Tax=Allonocardiopsis opalescens TaxID=1144618 RepID=A0A2T0QBW2_9ACTN|nr:5-(carboxyamino)imidazole ribonucleotide synthase [Allonocardiopsis opalescens]
MPVVGMVGAGQLARMTQQAAIALGVRLRVMSPDGAQSADAVVPGVALGDHRSLPDLLAFGRTVDVVTFDHEHVPTEHLAALEQAGAAVRPGGHALLFAQDKSAMRRRLAELAAPVPRWRAVATPADVDALAEQTGWPVVLKAARGGYDGRGVWVCETRDDAKRLVTEIQAAGTELLAEERVDFTRELAAVVARSPYGQAAAYPVVETVQREGICREVIAPAPGLAEETALAAQRLALRLADELDVTGLLTVELFETRGGIVVNELAMRPHNSAHWTIDGARTSQFEQHLRAVLDLPLGSTAPLAPYTVMANLLGGRDADVYSRYTHVMARDPGAKVHFYGKEVRPGRKIGHVTVLGDDLADLLERARHAVDYLNADRYLKG